MNELIKIREEKGKVAVSARELYNFLGLSERFSKWFDRFREYGFEEGVDYTPYQMVHPSNGQEITDYVLTLDMSKELSMLQRTDKGKQARKYFIECEKKLKEKTDTYLPQTYLEALKALVVSEEKRIEAEGTVKILTHTNKTYTATEVAKECGLRSANELNKRLEELGIQYKQNGTWIPKADYSCLAWFDIKQEVLDNGHIIYHRKITGIGRTAIINLIANGNTK